MSDLPLKDAPQQPIAPSFGQTAVVSYAGISNQDSVEPAFAALVHALQQPFDALTAASPIHTVRHADSIVIVNPTFARADIRLSRLASVATRAQMANKPLALVGVTAWRSSWTTKKLVSALIARSDLTLLADVASADALADMGIEGPFRIGADPAWASLGGLQAANDVGTDRVVWTSSGGITDAVRHFDHLCGVVTAITSAGLTFQLQPTVAQDYESLVEMGERVAAFTKASVEVLKPALDLADSRSIFSGARVVVATDKLSLMAAAASGSPTLALSLVPEVRRMADNLGVRAMLPTQNDASLAAAVLRRAQGQTPVDQSLVLQNIDRANATISLVRTLLSHGSEVSSDAIESLPLYPQAWRV